MLHPLGPNQNPNGPSTWDQERSFSEVVDIDDLLGAIRRQWRVIALCVVAGLVLGIAYAVSAVPLFTAGTDILVDQSNAKLVEQLSEVGAPEASAPEIISQLEVLQSDNVILAVVDALELTKNALFMRVEGSLTDLLKSKLRGDSWPAVWTRSALSVIPGFSSWLEPAHAPPSQEEIRLDAMRRLQSNLSVSRVGDSFVLNVSFTSEDPALAATIANAVAEAYLADQLASKFGATQGAGAWFEQRVADMRRKTVDANAAVQRYRTEHGLFGSDDELLTDKQLSEVSSQLILAQADTAETEAKLGRIKAIIDSGQADALVSDALESSVIDDLRTRYLNASRLAAEVTASFGPDHAQAIKLRAEMQGYERQINEELRRIYESYKSDYEVAKSREDSLRSNLATATGMSAAANQMLAELSELELSAESYNKQYQALLERHEAALAQHSFPITEARIITPATVPPKSSYPKLKVVLALAGALGLAVGAAAGSYREIRDRSFRTGDQVRDDLRLDFFGFTPALARRDLARSRIVRSHDPRTVASTPSFAITHPLSTFSETLRSVKVAADIALNRKRPVIIGVVSILPGEGKSTIATNFAELLASQGSRTLLIDGDLRNPGLTRTLARHASVGLVECIGSELPVNDALLFNPASNLAVLPAVMTHRLPHTSEMLASPGMANVLSQACSAFEHIVIDLPPIAALVDARAIAPRIDAFLLVIQWGKTARQLVRRTLDAEPGIAGKCLGVVLNRVNLRKLALYQTYEPKDYYFDNAPRTRGSKKKGALGLCAGKTRRRQVSERE